MLFQMLSAMAQKRWAASTSSTPPPPRTVTPLADLTQRGMVEISSIPLILAEGANSLLKPLPGRNIVTAIGRLDYNSLHFYRVYLSQGDGAFIHLAVGSDPKKLLECRLYQPYYEVVPQQSGANELSWEFWLKDNPDPQVGGMIGCPVMQGKNEDGAIPYQRSWLAGGLRVQPVLATENLLDIDGNNTRFSHTMMHYGRRLNDTVNEYLLASAVETPDSASVNMWLGIDIEVSDLTIYPVS
jgi:hypothetical protein